MANEYRNCIRCNKIYVSYTGRKICNECNDKLLELLKEVKEYVRNNKDVDINDVCDTFNISPNLVLDWIYREELELRRDSLITIYCRNCNEQIYSGQYCNKCKSFMLREMNSMLPKSRVEENNIAYRKDKERMRFIK